jgi:hypothetical protein
MTASQSGRQRQRETWGIGAPHPSEKAFKTAE